MNNCVVRRKVERDRRPIIAILTMTLLGLFAINLKIILSAYANEPQEVTEISVSVTEEITEVDEDISVRVTEDLPKTAVETTAQEPKNYPYCSSYADAVSKYDWDVSTALAIMRAESGCRSDADNTGLNKDGSYDIGLFQINSIHGYSKSYLMNSDNNIAVAYKIYKSSGWRAWSAYNNGAYKKYL